MTRSRFEPEHRKELILKAAIITARRPGGWSTLTRQAIAKQADCSEGLVSRYLGPMWRVRRAIMRDAIKQEIVEIIVQSLVAQDGCANKSWLPQALKQKAISSLSGK